MKNHLQTIIEKTIILYYKTTNKSLYRNTRDTGYYISMNHVKVTTSITAIVSIAIFIATPILAKTGVGIGIGKISIDEPLSSGGIYELPAIPVINTGDEATTYDISVTYFADQPQLKVKPEWVTFQPSQLRLEPGQSQTTSVTLTLPLKTPPGDYFALLQAKPATSDSGVSVGVAAATKLSFTIQPGSVLGAAVHRARNLIDAHRATALIIASISLFAPILFLAKRYLNIKISLKNTNQQ